MIAVDFFSGLGAGLFRYLIADPDPFLAPIAGEAVAPYFVPRYGERPGQPPRSRRVTRPMPTVVGTGNGAQLVAATLAKFYGTAKTSDIKQPLGTVTSGGGKFGLVAMHLAKHYGGVIGTRLDQPLGTISGRDSQGPTAAHLALDQIPDERTSRVVEFMRAHLGQPIGTRKGRSTVQRIELDAGSIVSRGGNSMLVVDVAGERYAVVDIGLRMLQPAELAVAQGFPIDYRLVGTKTQQIAKIGNSVPPPVVRALVEANVKVERRFFAA